MGLQDGVFPHPFRLEVLLCCSRLGCVPMVFCREASHNLRAPRCRRPPGKHGLFHVQGRRQPEACDHLAAQQVSRTQ